MDGYDELYSAKMISLPSSSSVNKPVEKSDKTHMSMVTLSLLLSWKTIDQLLTDNSMTLESHSPSVVEESNDDETVFSFLGEQNEQVRNSMRFS